MKLIFTILIALTSIIPESHNKSPLPYFDTYLISGQVLELDSKETVQAASVFIKELKIGTTTDANGEFSLRVPKGEYTLQVMFIGYKTYSQNIKVESTDITNLKIELEYDVIGLDEVVVSGYATEVKRSITSSVQSFTLGAPSNYTYENHNNEQYDAISENIYKWAKQTPLSTFSIDVDAASYSNVRRMIMDGALPPVDAVRVEEMINYFTYDYSQPINGHPFSVETEVAPAPWNPSHQLVQIGIQGEQVDADNLPPSNLVFLLDVSGSMGSHDKLPLLKKGFKLLVNQLREEDYVSIVVYAGSSGLVLPPTSGYEKETILEALDRLQSGGSTAGAQGIKQAYDIALKNFREDANNRVILATDGDFNVGVSSDKALVKLIEEKRDHGIFLSVLGFGTGNLKDSKMEKIADHGNGNYYYIDNLLEAKKVLVSEMGGTLHTIAKDVKIQVEFNPANVQAYRLIGYENRLLADEDFNDDKKDAGELGSGHTVTALYEVVPVGATIDSGLLDVDPLKYQTPKTPTKGLSDEIMTVKLRYKEPQGDDSKLITHVIKTTEVSETLSENLSFSAAVASFGMLLRDSKFKGDATFDLVDQLARNGKGSDMNGYRSEFIKIAELADLLSQGQSKK
ncbi:MAG: von Willebrand factor type A domain-containing protein [Balneolaceae bacterium]